MEIVERAWQALNRGDLDAQLALMDEDVEFRPPASEKPSKPQG